MSNQLQTLLETRRFTVVEQSARRPDGQPATLQYVVHPGSVGVLPLLVDGRVCLIRSRRLTVDKTLVEIPAGTREPDETPRETARRELAEETGYRTARIEELGVYYPSPGITNEQIWLFVAHDLTAGDHAREANEEIENLIVTWDEALAMVDRHEIEDGKTVIAILLWERRRQT